MIPEEFWQTINPIPQSITDRTIEQVQGETLKRYAKALKGYCEGRNSCLKCLFNYNDTNRSVPCKLSPPPQHWELEEPQ